MNIIKLSTKDLEKVNSLPLLLVYRNTLKLLRTYPSIKKDELRLVCCEGIFSFY